MLTIARLIMQMAFGGQIRTYRGQQCCSEARRLVAIKPSTPNALESSDPI